MTGPRGTPELPPEVEDLRELLDLVAGRGEWSWLGGGIWTYPTRTEERHALLNSACLRLEAAGLLRRETDEGESILWKAVHP